MSAARDAESNFSEEEKINNGNLCASEIAKDTPWQRISKLARANCLQKEGVIQPLGYPMEKPLVYKNHSLHRDGTSAEAEQFRLCRNSRLSSLALAKRRNQLSQLYLESEEQKNVSSLF
jgi:hypothetical protein